MFGCAHNAKRPRRQGSSRPLKSTVLFSQWGIRNAGCEILPVLLSERIHNPAKIEKIEDDTAVVDYGGVRKDVNVSLLEKVKVGDYVLIHAGFAIELLNRKSAEESLEIIRNYSKMTRL